VEDFDRRIDDGIQPRSGDDSTNENDMLGKELDHLRFGGSTAGNINRQFFYRIIRSHEFMAIDQQKDFSNRNGHPLVPIDEGMILAKMEVEGGSHVAQLIMQEFSTKRRARHGSSRFEQPAIT